MEGFNTPDSRMLVTVDDGRVSKKKVNLLGYRTMFEYDMMDTCWDMVLRRKSDMVMWNLLTNKLDVRLGNVPMTIHTIDVLRNCVLVYCL